MVENVTIQASLTREEKYVALLPQLRALTEGETDVIANLSNLVAALKETFGFFWVGVYLVKGKTLVLGPFQGPVACTRIAFGKGVCGKAWEDKRSLLVPDVDRFPGHIACSSQSRSEVVVPVLGRNGEVSMMLDIDSDRLDDFSDVDRRYLEEVALLIRSFAG